MSSAINHKKRSHRSEAAHYYAVQNMPKQDPTRGKFLDYGAEHIGSSVSFLSAIKRFVRRRAANAKA